MREALLEFYGLRVAVLFACVINLPVQVGSFTLEEGVVGERSPLVRVNSQANVLLGALLGAGWVLRIFSAEVLVMLTSFPLKNEGNLVLNLVNGEHGGAVLGVGKAHLVGHLELTQLVWLQKSLQLVVTKLKMRLLVKDFELN